MVDVIVVGTDGAETAQLAVDEAIRLAKRLGSVLHVVSAFLPVQLNVAGALAGAPVIWEPLPDTEVHDTLVRAAALAGERGVEAITHAIEAYPVDALLEVAKDVGATMLVVGSIGMHGAKRLKLGNVPNQISHKARCNVLIVYTDEPPA